MNNSVKVNVKNPYEIFLDSSLETIPALLKEYTNQKNIIIICDKNIAKKHLPLLLKSLINHGFSPNVLLLKASEKNKSIKVANDLIKKILKLEINKKTPLIALGGGIVGDIAGFCASVVYRGLPFFQIPTTLLAMVDSSVGGKNGVNTNAGKNTLGTFYQPSAVFIDVSLLETLSDRDYLSGYAEVVKYALLFSKEYFNYLENHRNLFLAKNHNYLINIVKNSCGFKAKVVEEDEFETNNIRYLLNLGHTFAHAFEAYNKYKPTLSHGEAVSVGMVLAFKLSYSLGICARENYLRIKDHLDLIGLPTEIKHIFKKINVKKIIKLMGQDKKNHSSLFTLILAVDMGNCVVNNEITKAILKKFFKEVLNGKL
ncbi:MAG: 3-dehydroquinate synthase [Alphaproteobacteria bacterium]|nr:3-dehydroquinate synthase [Alphaproteobacteria bacterium]